MLFRLSVSAYNIMHLSLYFFSLFYQNATEELLLKCNLRINFIIRRNLYIFKNYAFIITGFIITWDYNPFCFTIIIPMINNNNFTRTFLFSSKTSFPCQSSILCVCSPYFTYTSHRSLSIIYKS